MRKIIGVLIIIMGAILALYVGGWLMFIGGIVALIEEIRADMLDSGRVAWSIARIMLAGFVGSLIFWASTLLGVMVGGLEDKPLTKIARNMR